MHEEFYQSPVENRAKNATIEVKSTSFLSRVYGYMFIWVLITALVATGVGLLFNFLVKNMAGNQDTIMMTFLITIISSGVVLLVLSILINVIALKDNRRIMPWAIAYAVIMGLFFSVFVFIEVPFWILGSAFAITSITFGIMYFIARFTKRNLSWVGYLGYGLLFGIFLISIMSVVFFFVFRTTTGSQPWWLYSIIDGAMFIAILLISMFDVWRIQKIADKGMESRNLAEYCAFTLYTDFVYILMRVILFLLQVFGKNN